MRQQSETRSLPTPLTAEELAEESKLLAEADLAVNRQEEVLAEAVGKWKKSKKLMEECLGYLKTQAAEQLEIVHSETKAKDVPCSWLYALEIGYAFLLRDDTGELVHHRKLGEQERQKELLEVLREPTPEQLATWVESLGLVLDPQQGLPLAAPESSASSTSAAADTPVFYYRDFTLTTADGDERITGRFLEADHRPESLAGIHSHGAPKLGTGLPEQLNRGALPYEDAEPTLQRYRRALEEILEAKRTEALKSRQEPEGEPEAEPKRTRKGK